MITGNRQITNGPDSEEMALKIAQLSHGKVDEDAISAEPTYDLACEEGLGNFEYILADNADY